MLGKPDYPPTLELHTFSFQKHFLLLPDGVRQFRTDVAPRTKDTVPSVD